jgi:ADP-heptose:LPS heptosyltransferase
MKLIEAYSKTTGLEIGEPFLMEKFYPLDCQKYITIQNGSGMPNAKNYDYWQEVILLVSHIFNANNIKIVLLGSNEDLVLEGVIDLRGKTDIQQSNYIIKRSLLHIGNDSCLAHLAGINKIPLIALYGSTTVANHSPFWTDKEKTILIESHRFGQNPSFSNQEYPKTVNLLNQKKL